MGKRKTILDIHKNGWRTHLKMIKFGCHQKLVWKRPPESWSIVSPFEHHSTRAGATKIATNGRGDFCATPGSCKASTCRIVLYIDPKDPHSTPSGELLSLYMSAMSASPVDHGGGISISFLRRAEAGRWRSWGSLGTSSKPPRHTLSANLDAI